MPYQDPYAGQSHFQTWTPAIDAANQDVPGGKGQYRAGGPNKIIWGGDVSAGTSGGETAWNPDTNSQQYVTGYDNTGWNPSGTESGSSSKVIGTVPATAQSATAASAPPSGGVPISSSMGGGGVGGSDVPVGGGASSLGGGIGAATGSNVTPPSMAGLDAAAGMTPPLSGAGVKELVGPGGLKQGLGTRIPPSMAALFQERAY